MSIVKKLFLLFLCIGSLSQASAQSTASPFSTFGIGERYGNALANNQGMAGIGISQPQFWFANNQNPALLIYNTLTVFNAGILVEQRKIKSDTLTETTKGGNLNYLVTAFPVIRTKWSTSIALAPYTSIKYNFATTEVVSGSNERFERLEQGTGGLTQLSWSNGVRLTKDMAVGLKASYIFGSYGSFYQNRSLVSAQPINYYATVEEKSYAKDFAFSAGFSFSRDSLFARQKYRVSFGAVYEFSSNIKTSSRVMLYRTNLPGDNGNKIDLDTLTGVRGSIKLPPGLTVGASIGRGKWAVGTEVSYYDWSDFNSLNSDDNANLTTSVSYALGGEITPDSYSSNYLKRMTYRTGFSFAQLPYLANENKVRDLGINFGLSLPAGSSSLDIGFRYGKRGNRSQNRIEEDYFKVFFGITFNDQWFIKRKFD
jgi:hypothetical protein